MWTSHDEQPHTSYGHDVQGKPSPKSKSAGVGWRRLAQILVTALALVLICRMVNWHDHAHLQDGSRYRIVDRSKSHVTVEIPGTEDPATYRTIPLNELEEIEPGIRSLMRSARWSWLTGYFVCVAAAAFLLVTRWRKLLVFQNSRRTEQPLLPSQQPSFLGCAVVWARSQIINLLPLSQIGGDLYRIERSSQWIDHRKRAIPEATGVIATERIMGLFAMIAVTITGIILSQLSESSTESQTMSEPAILPTLGFALLSTAIVGVALVLLRRRARSNGRQVSHARSTPSQPLSRFKQLTGWLESLLLSVAELTCYPRQLLRIAAFSFGIQLLIPLSYVTVDRALGFDTPAWCYLVAVPTISLATFLPIHIAGIGIIEGGLWLFLHQWTRHTPTDVLAISATVRIMGLAWLACLTPACLMRASPEHHPVGEDPSVPPTMFDQQRPLACIPDQTAPRGNRLRLKLLRCLGLLS